jgi:4-hydroxymandelate oxidase
VAGDELRIAGLGRAEFPAEATGCDVEGIDAELREFVTDLVAPHGLTPDLSPYRPGVPDSHAELSTRAMDTVGAAGAPVDLVIIGYTVPDADPRRSPAHLVAQRLPGDPLVFAISDQGTAATFTALSVIQAYRRDAGFQRALLLLLDRGALPYRSVPTAASPPAAAAVAIRFDDSGPDRLTGLRQYPDVVPDQVAPLLAGELGAGPTILAGAVTARYLDLPRGQPIRVAPAGRLCTAAWWELIGGSIGESGALLVDYDPDLRYLSLAHLNRPAATSIEER